MGAPRPQHAGRRLGLALALALLLHVSGAWWLFSKHLPRPETRRIQVTLLVKPKPEIKPVTPRPPPAMTTLPPAIVRRRASVPSHHGEVSVNPPEIAGPPRPAGPPAATPNTSPAPGGGGAVTPGPVRLFDHDALASTEHWTGILTVITKPPTTAEVLRRNPLGLYDNAIDWSRELDAQ